MFDVGGVSLDVSLIMVGHEIFEIEATVGDRGLGGVNSDDCLVECVLDTISTS